MRGMPNSIQGRLFLSIITFTSLLFIAVGAFIYREVNGIVIGAVDRTLHSKAQVITGLLHEENNTIELELEEVVSGEYSIPRSGHYFRVMMNGKLLAASPSLVKDSFDLDAGAPEPADEDPGEDVYTSVGPAGEPIRVLRHNLSAFGMTFTVFVAESLSDSLDMISTFRRFLLLVIPSGIVIASLICLWIARQSLTPLARFSGMIETITHKNLGERIDAASETRELAGLAGSFNRMLDRLQKVFESEKRLIADASHELKTPVSVIKVQCDVVLQRERTPEEYVDAIQTIRTVSDTISITVRDLLSLARLDSGVLSQGFAVVSLNACIERALEMTKPFAEKRHLQVIVALGDDVAIPGNSESLTEAFLNILENGVKYNREYGVLELTAVGSGAQAVVSIKDTGVGMGKEDQARIFDRFYRADTARNSDGTGLGLSIAKAIIDAHGGAITLESEPGKGTTFMVALPVNRHTIEKGIMPGA